MGEETYVYQGKVVQDGVLEVYYPYLVTKESVIDIPAEISKHEGKSVYVHITVQEEE